MRTLILSCNTGEGHNSAAKAIREYFWLQSEFCFLEDSLAFASERMSKFISGWHVRLYRYLPAAFGQGYGFVERHPAYLEKGSPAFNALTIGTKRLYEYIVAKGIDTVVCTHVFSAMLLTKMMSKYPIKLKTALVFTDYTCFPGTSACDMDVYFIPHSSLTSVFERAGISREKLLPAGIPVMQRFFETIPKKEAKMAVGVDPSKRHILMMSGSMGCGPIEETAIALAQRKNDNCEITVVCGTNGRMKSRLEKSLEGREGVHILGYSKNISTLLDSADVYFTKPGGISTSEAAKKAVPMVLIQAVEGCETHNYRFFTSQGVAVLSGKPDELAEKGLEIIRTEGRLEQMSAAYSEELRCNGAKIIYEKLKSM